MKIYSVLTALLIFFSINVFAQENDCVSLGDNVFPEDIIVHDGQLYASHFFSGAITQVDLSSGAISEFVPPSTSSLPTAWGLRVDAANNVLLACVNIAWDFDPSTASAGAVNAYDLSSGALVNSWTLPTGCVGHAIDLDSNGNYYVSDIGPDSRIIKIDPSTNTVSVWADDAQWADGGFGMGGIVFNQSNGIYASQSDLLWFVPINADGTSGTVEQVTFAGGDNGVPADGLTWIGNNTMYYCDNDAFTPGPNGTFTQIVLNSPTTGTQTQIASDIADASGASFDPSTNTLYAAASQFGAAFGVDAAPENPFCVRTFEYVPVVNDDVPTVGEWGLIIMALLLLNVVLINVVVNGKTSLQLSNGQTEAAFSWSNRNSYPFNKEIFFHAVMFTTILVSFIGMYALTFYGFFTLVDIVGVTITSPIFAYLLHLLVLSNKQDA